MHTDLRLRMYVGRGWIGAMGEVQLEGHAHVAVR